MANKKFTSWHIRRSKGYHKLEWVNSGELLDVFVRFISPKPEEICIDLGTGSGKVAEAIYKKEKSATVIGVDYSMEMLTRAAKQIRAPLVWIQGDANFLPFPEGIVDKISARMILHHLVNPLKAVLECHRILRFGGSFFICEGIAPNKDSFNNWVKMNQFLEPGRKTFSPEILERLLIDAGFVKIKKKVIITSQLSTRNWLKNRGDSPKIIKMVMEMRKRIPEGEKKAWNLKETGDDILVDVPWLMIIGHKPIK